MCGGSRDLVNSKRNRVVGTQRTSWRAPTAVVQYGDERLLAGGCLVCLLAWNLRTVTKNIVRVARDLAAPYLAWPRTPSICRWLGLLLSSLPMGALLCRSASLNMFSDLTPPQTTDRCAFLRVVANGLSIFMVHPFSFAAWFLRSHLGARNEQNTYVCLWRSIIYLVRVGGPSSRAPTIVTLRNRFAVSQTSRCRALHTRLVL